MLAVRTSLLALAALLVASLSLAAPSGANVPGGGGSTCTAYASPSITSSTATAHVAGTDNCATPRYWVRMMVGINTSSGNPSKTITYTCSTNLNYVESCAENGVSVSVPNPAGTQTWDYCGTLYFYSSVTSGLVKTIESCGYTTG